MLLDNAYNSARGLPTRLQALPKLVRQESSRDHELRVTLLIDLNRQ